MYTSGCRGGHRGGSQAERIPFLGNSELPSRSAGAEVRARSDWQTTPTNPAPVVGLTRLEQPIVRQLEHTGETRFLVEREYHPPVTSVERHVHVIF